MGDLTTPVRALAHPGAVLALAVLVINDHVLKQAWPGWFTGKLSDVAGVVVAPLLLSVVLTVLRVARPMPVAVVATAAGFVFCKTTTLGAAATSAVWSLFGTPTMIRSDVTDLIALPFLVVPWWIFRTVASRSGEGWRRTVAVVVGTALLPVGVLATSATSCETDEGISGVEAVEGRFTGTRQQAFFVVEDHVHDDVKVDPLTAAVSGFAQRDRAGLVEADTHGSVACDRTGMTCWRIEGESVLDRVVEMSRDGGVTWTTDLVVSHEEQERSVDGVDPGCGDDPAASFLDVAVLDTDEGTAVMVTAKHAGVWLREPAGAWSLVPRDSLRVDSAGADQPNDQESGSIGPARGRLFVVHVPPARSVDGWAGRTPAPPAEPMLPCGSPTRTTVTPNPLNGPPTTYEVCPDDR